MRFIKRLPYLIDSLSVMKIEASGFEKRKNKLEITKIIMIDKRKAICIPFLILSFLPAPKFCAIKVVAAKEILLIGRRIN